MAEDSVKGNKSRGVSFKLDSPEEYALYKFSFGLNLSEFVKRCLAQEYRRQRSTQSELTIDTSMFRGDR